MLIPVDYFNSFFNSAVPLSICHLKKIALELIFKVIDDYLLLYATFYDFMAVSHSSCLLSVTVVPQLLFTVCHYCSLFATIFLLFVAKLVAVHHYLPLVQTIRHSYTHERSRLQIILNWCILLLVHSQAVYFFCNFDECQNDTVISK